MGAAVGHHSRIRAAEILGRIKVEHPTGAEIGVFVGQLSCLLLERPDLFLFMVDSWKPGSEQPQRYKDAGDFHSNMTLEAQETNRANAEKATEFAGRRRKIIHMDSSEAAGITPDFSLDFVFIDADHTYIGCRQDIDLWRHKVKPGGLLSGHDYDNPEPACSGVKTAVDEAVKKHGWSLELGNDFTWFVRL